VVIRKWENNIKTDRSVEER